MSRQAAGIAGGVAVLLASGHALAQRSAAHEPGLIDRVRAMTVAVVHGDLAAVAAAADWIGRHAAPVAAATGDPTGHAALAGAVSDGARKVAAASDLTAAASATSTLLAACGDCHQRSGVAPRLEPRTAGGGPSVAEHMRRHQEAADLLLEGLVSPSPEAWIRGARLLTGAPLAPGDFPVSTRIGGIMATIETSLHGQAAGALTAEASARPRTYATILTTCSQCHTRHTTLWNSPPR